MKMDQSFPSLGGGEVKPIEYQAIDLGLPSGLKWCNMNVGASSPEDGGLYFAWGDTQGYTVDQVGTGKEQKKFSSDFSDYKFGKSPFTKYTSSDGLTVLDLEDDAAHVNMGGDWRTPTKDDLQELLDNTTNKVVSDHNGTGMSGRVFTSKVNGNSIFVPAAGCAKDGSVVYIGSVGLLWLNSLEGVGTNRAWILYFGSDLAGRNVEYRSYGLPVRAVLGQ